MYLISSVGYTLKKYPKLSSKFMKVLYTTILNEKKYSRFLWSENFLGKIQKCAVIRRQHNLESILVFNLLKY